VCSVVFQIPQWCATYLRMFKCYICFKLIFQCQVIPVYNLKHSILRLSHPLNSKALCKHVNLRFYQTAARVSFLLVKLICVFQAFVSCLVEFWMQQLHVWKWHSLTPVLQWQTTRQSYFILRWYVFISP
jgi:hypothetical protein